MNRDDYAKMKARQEIIVASINKLEKATVEDVELIPALCEYINTGDYKMFKEFRQFHNMKEKEKKIEEHNIYVESQMERYKASSKNFDLLKKLLISECAKLRKYLEDYNEYINSTEKLLDNNDCIKRNTRSLKSLFDFLNNDAKELVSKNNVLYVYVDGKLRVVRNIEILNGKDKSRVVLSLSEDDCILQHRSPRYIFTRYIYDISDFDRIINDLNVESPQDLKIDPF